MSEEYGNQQDPTRLCPTCRMPISVLATRCRHCGETVARPRREEHRLTVHDLGGEQKTNYTISGNVMDALEAFRAEELSAQEMARQEKSKSSSWFGRSNTPLPGDSIDHGMPELDAQHLELANLSGPRTHSTSRNLPPPSRVPAMTRTAFTIAAMVAGLVLLYLGGGYTWGKVSDYLDRRNAPVTIDYSSKALKMLESGLPMADVYKEAVDAVKATDKEENRIILDKVRQELLEKVEKALKEPTLDLRRMAEASTLISEAARLDNDRRVQSMWQQVQRDQAAYKMVLTGVDVSKGEATFKLNNVFADKDEETVKVGSYVQDRFLVTAITERGVRLEDTRVPTLSGKGRTVNAKLRSVLGSG